MTIVKVTGKSSYKEYQVDIDFPESPDISVSSVAIDLGEPPTQGGNAAIQSDHPSKIWEKIATAVKKKGNLFSVSTLSVTWADPVFSAQCKATTIGSAFLWALCSSVLVVSIVFAAVSGLFSDACPFLLSNSTACLQHAELPLGLSVTLLLSNFLGNTALVVTVFVLMMQTAKAGAMVNDKFSKKKFAVIISLFVAFFFAAFAVDVATGLFPLWLSLSSVITTVAGLYSLAADLKSSIRKVIDDLGTNLFYSELVEDVPDV